MVRIFKSTALLALALFFLLPRPLGAEDKPEAGKKRITWEESEGVVRYDVTIKNSSEEILISSSTQKGEIEIDLPAGTYWIQITAVNKFDKIGQQSDWQKFEIKQAPKKEKSIFVQDLLNVGLKINAGYFYSVPLEDWADTYNDGYTAALLRFSLNFGNLGLLKNYRFFRHFGLEADTSFSQFEGKQVPGKIKFDTMNISAGCNAFLTTALSLPINVTLRFGGGGYFTRFEYAASNTTESVDIWSTDPYFLTGLSIEITFYRFLFLEIGADFVYVDYIGKDFMSVRYVAMIGIRL